MSMAYAHVNDQNRQFASTLSPADSQWLKELTDSYGVGCCDAADGYPAEAEYDTKNDQYRVYLCWEPVGDTCKADSAAWFDVPAKSVIKTPNRMGYAMVWYYWSRNASTGEFVANVRCFIPGTGV